MRQSARCSWLIVLKFFALLRYIVDWFFKGLCVLGVTILASLHKIALHRYLRLCNGLLETLGKCDRVLVKNEKSAKIIIRISFLLPFWRTLVASVTVTRYPSSHSGFFTRYSCSRQKRTVTATPRSCARSQTTPVCSSENPLKKVICATQKVIIAL